MTPHRHALLVATGVILLAATTFSTAKAQFDTIRVPRDTIRMWRDRGFPYYYIPGFFRIERLSVIDIMPNGQSGESAQDAETNLAVDPQNTSHIVASAFTRNPDLTVSNVAPIYVSTNGGTGWGFETIVPSTNGSTGDISLAFATRGHHLYTGILDDGSFLRQKILRTADPFTATTMTVLIDHSGDQRDQPFPSAVTTTVSGSDVDRVYHGFNFFQQRIALGGTSRTAATEFSLDAATAAPPAGFTTLVVEAVNTFQQNMPATRFAVHSGGVIYGVFYRWTGTATPSAVCDVIVVRDDAFATGAAPFTALTSGTPAVAGNAVGTGRTVPAFPASLGQNRLVASNLSIAVSPVSAATVYVAWADSDATSFYTLHVRRSTDSGATWSGDLLTLANATNPALAVNSDGVLGFAYQQLTGTGATRRWKTHIQRSTDTGTSWYSDIILADVPNSAGTVFMGDYQDLVTVGRSFYGVFPALNTPNLANFPQGVTFLRNVNFTTNQVRDLANTANVTASIDPFFYKIESISIFDRCLLAPRLCAVVTFDPGFVHFEVTELPPKAIDPIPKNCLVKFSCPGCDDSALCPGYYHFFIDDISPEDWRVEVLGPKGEVVRQQMARVGKGIVVSFRPDKKNFRPKDVGDYYLAFEGVGKVGRGKYTFGMRLEVSPYPQGEQLRRDGLNKPQ